MNSELSWRPFLEVTKKVLSKARSRPQCVIITIFESMLGSAFGSIYVSLLHSCLGSVSVCINESTAGKYSQRYTIDNYGSWYGKVKSCRLVESNLIQWEGYLKVCLSTHQEPCWVLYLIVSFVMHWEEETNFHAEHRVQYWSRGFLDIHPGVNNKANMEYKSKSIFEYCVQYTWE